MLYSEGAKLNIIKKLLDCANLNKTWYFPAENTELSISELINEIQKYAAALKSLGVKKGERVGLVSSNSSDLVCLLYACWYINAVAVPLRTQTGRYQTFEDYIQRCDDVCDFKLLVLEDDIYSSNFEKWAVINRKPTYNITYIKQIEALPLIKSTEIEQDDIAIIQFSSGSTGRPKGVVVTHSMIMAQLQNLDELFRTPNHGADVECYAIWAPINHDMGMFVGVLSPIYQGVNNILAPPTYFMRNPVRWYRMMAERNVEVAMFTNSVLSKSLPALERKLKSIKLDLSRCRIYLGAEKVSSIVIKEAYRVLKPLFGGRDNLFIGYGMAENSLGATTTLSEEIPILRVSVEENNKVIVHENSSDQGNEIASVGVPYSNHTVSIRNDINEVLPELMLGEIHIESHCLSPGYYNDSDKTSAEFNSGRFKTKDLGFWYLGQLYFFSRKDDLIIINGQNIIPDDVELTIESLDFVRASSSLLCSVEDEKTGVETLHLLVESNANISFKEVNERTKKIVEHAFVELGVVVNKVYLCAKGTIEKTSSGKKRRKVIKQRFINKQIDILTWTEENESQTAI